MTKVLIRVKEHHILHGHSRCCTECPLALAILESARKFIPELEFVGVSAGCARLHHKNKGLTQTVVLSNKAVNFYVAFDTGERVEPFDFFIEVIL